MFDIGIGELLALAVVGLLIFGPEKLPKAAADAGRWARQIRQMASSARQEIVDSAGIDLNDTMSGLKDLRDLHPRRLASGLFDDSPEATAGARASEASGRDRPVDSDEAAPNGSSASATKGQSAQAFDPDLS